MDLVTCVLNKLPGPDAIAARSASAWPLFLVLDGHGHVKSGRGEQTWLVLVHFGVQKGQLKQVLRQIEDD